MGTPYHTTTPADLESGNVREIRVGKRSMESSLIVNSEPGTKHAYWQDKANDAQANNRSAHLRNIAVIYLEILANIAHGFTYLLFEYQTPYQDVHSYDQEEGCKNTA